MSEDQKNSWQRLSSLPITPRDPVAHPRYPVRPFGVEPRVIKTLVELPDADPSDEEENERGGKG